MVAGGFGSEAVRVLVDVASWAGREERANEDYVAMSADAAVVVDGAGTPAGAASGCRHGVAWFARSLALAFVGELSGAGSLVDGLAAAIGVVRSAHGDGCDLGHPGSPAATVVAVRFRQGVMEYLVLCDAVLAVDVAGGEPLVVSDDRLAVITRRLRAGMDALATGLPEHEAARTSLVEELQAYRNVPGGYWVAAAEPMAAGHAFTGELPVADVAGVALLSDGASRLVDRFGLFTWAQLLRTLRSEGASELLARTRAAEDSDRDGRRWPRGKAHDDATCAYLGF